MVTAADAAPCEHSIYASIDRTRDRLGVALAGGGFRAALFHVGTLRYLANQDLLRRVEVISCVSGGSITGALYCLLLKQALEGDLAPGVHTHTNGRGCTYLDNAAYRRIIDRLEAIVRQASQANLRMRLLINPLTMLRVAFTRQTLSSQMAGLYDRHLFLQASGKTQFKLADLRVGPVSRAVETGEFPDIDSYNRAQIAAGERGSAVTKLILNATCLNTGGRFWFSVSEIGEWRLGFAHVGDFSKPAGASATQVAGQSPNDAPALSLECLKRRYEQRIASRRAHFGPCDDTDCLIDWIEDKAAGSDGLPQCWRGLIESAHRYGLRLESIKHVELGSLRLARNAAWRLRNWPTDSRLPYFGGRSIAEHKLFLAHELGYIGHQYTGTVTDWIGSLDVKTFCNLIDLVNLVYLLRSANNLATTLRADFERWTLASAVAASANFPPLFAPLRVNEFYDDITVPQVGLTDGGVYDNLGAMGLLNEHCNYIIASDSDKEGAQTDGVAQGRLGMAQRLLTILNGQGVRSMRIRLLELHEASVALERLGCAAVRPEEATSKGCRPEEAQAFCSSLASKLDAGRTGRELHALAMCRINSDMVVEQSPGDGAPAYSPGVLASVRTDLDAFGDIECAALIGHGHDVASLCVDKWFYFNNGLPLSDGGKTSALVPDHIDVRYGPRGADGTGGAYPYTAIRQAGSDARRVAFAPARLRPSLRNEAVLAAAGHSVFRGSRLWCHFAKNPGKVVSACVSGENGRRDCGPLLYLVAGAVAALLIGYWLYRFAAHTPREIATSMWSVLDAYVPAFSWQWPGWSLRGWGLLAALVVFLSLFVRRGANHFADKARTLRERGELEHARRWAGRARWVRSIRIWIWIVAPLIVAHFIGGWGLVTVVVATLLLGALAVPLLGLLAAFESGLHTRMASLRRKGECDG